MKIHIRILATLVILCCLLPGCNSEGICYRTYKENGEWYFQFTKEPPRPEIIVFGEYGTFTESPGNDRGAAPVYFASVLEMARTIKSGALHAQSLYLIRNALSEDTFQIVDLDALYEPVLPDDLMITDGLFWDLTRCEFQIKGSSSAVEGKFYIDYSLPYYPRIPDVGETVKYEVILDDNTADRKARDIILEIYGVKVEKESPHLCYRLVNGENTYIIKEVSRREIIIFAECGSAAMYIKLEGLTGYPTLNWISQFGLKPLEGAY